MNMSLAPVGIDVADVTLVQSFEIRNDTRWGLRVCFNMKESDQNGIYEQEDGSELKSGIYDINTMLFQAKGIFKHLRTEGCTSQTAVQYSEGGYSLKSQGWLLSDPNQTPRKTKGPIKQIEILFSDSIVIYLNKTSSEELAKIETALQAIFPKT